MFTNTEFSCYRRDTLTDSVDGKGRLKTKREGRSSTTPTLHKAQEATESRTRRYRYRELRGVHSIRLLRFLPGSNDRDIRCTVDEYDTDSESTAYVALSYVWGDATIRYPISIDGEIAYITSNLRQALAHLADAFSQRSFWIDAICIDQNNLQERMHQVAQMRTIYSNATEVIMWLGPGHEGIERLCSEIESHNIHCSFPGLAYKNCRFQIDSGILAAVQHLIRQPYWSRVWIIQEVTTAKKIIPMCGNTLLNWPDFTHFLYNLGTSHFTMSKELAFDQLDYQVWSLPIHRLANWRYNFTRLAGALNRSALSFATDSRDKVYALHSLVNRGAGRFIPADYTLSPCNVFCLAIRAMMVDCNLGIARCVWCREVGRLPKACLDNALQRDRPSADEKVRQSLRQSIVPTDNIAEFSQARGYS